MEKMRKGTLDTNSKKGDRLEKSPQPKALHSPTRTPEKPRSHSRVWKGGRRQADVPKRGTQVSIPRASEH